MNGQQRRRLKRIRQRQRESAERRLTQGDRKFIKLVCPPPSRVCVMTPEQAKHFDEVSIGHRCTAIDHRHYSRKHVEMLFTHEVVDWVGKHQKIAQWIKEVHWEQRGQAMQLVPGADSKRGANQHTQNMPHLSKAFRRRKPVAMLNDGRAE